MRVKSVEIKGLYHQFNYNIVIGDGVQLLTGLNGYGKTTIMRLIDGLAQKNLYYFYVTPYDSITFAIDDESTIFVSSSYARKETGKARDERLSPSRKIVFTWVDKNGFKRGELVMDEDSISWAHHNLSKYGDMDDSQEVDFLSMDFYHSAKENGLPLEIAGLQGKLASQFMMLLGTIKSYLIEAERTVIYKSIHNTGVDYDLNGVSKFEIDVCNDILRQYLKEQYDGYKKHVAILDEKFVDNALKLDREYSEEEYQTEATKLSERKLELLKTGLIDSFDIRAYSTSNAKMLTAYIVSQNAKLDFHNELLGKLRLFSDLIASKRFVNKHLEISKDAGLRFMAGEGGYIDLNRLSSGEQNEVIMLYYLIFKVKDGSTLLIDEPETSLHVLWQNEYVSNIERIAKLKDLSVVVSTHSPQIIGSRWADCYDLTEVAERDEQYSGKS